MYPDAGTQLHLRGGALADGSGYNPSGIVAGPFDSPRRRRGRSESRRRGARSNGSHTPQQRQQEERNHLLPSGEEEEYIAVPRDPLYSKRARQLGIEDSLLCPAPLPPPDAQRLPWPWPWSSGGRRRSLGELTAGRWRPTRTRFTVRWPREDELPTEWYEGVYTHLYGTVRGLVREYFGYGDLPVVAGRRGGGGGGGRGGGVWLDGGFPKQFMWFVEKVAMQDNNLAGGWDELLVRRPLREYFVTGVVAKALETCVFDDLLFGADKDQKGMLEAQDRCTLELEGYQRTRLRAQCVRTVLGGDILTPEFWPRVDQLALQLATLLLPLLRIMDKSFPASQAKSLRSIYQELHAIVSEAGHLSIGIRRSQNIFRFSFPFPGEVWDLDQQEVDDTVYKISAAASNRADKAAEAKWTASQERRRRQEEEVVDSNPITSARRRFNSAWRRVLGRPADEDADGDGDKGGVGDVWRRPSRIAKVQIVLWPLLQWFATVGEVDSQTGVADGENVTTILRSQVVYYRGYAAEPVEQNEHYPTLDDWVHERTRKQTWNSLTVLRWVAYAAATWLLCNWLVRYSPVADDIVHIVRYGLEGTVKYIVREALLFVIEVLITVITFAVSVANTVMIVGYRFRDALGRLFGFEEGWYGVYRRDANADTGGPVR